MDLLLNSLGKRNPAMFRIAKEIEHAAEAIWNPPQAPWFTDHGPRHSRRIAALIEQILYTVGLSSKPKQLTPEELLILIGACFLHDAGMQRTSSINWLRHHSEPRDFRTLYDDYIRPAHPYILYDLILDQRPAEISMLGLANCPPQIQRAIAHVSLSHGRPKYLSQLEENPCSGGARLSLLGALLQIGDVLDLTWERVNKELTHFVDLSRVSEAHWILANTVASVIITSQGRVHVTYRLPHEISGDVLLVHRLRHYVEHLWIGTGASEAFQYLNPRLNTPLRLPAFQLDAEVLSAVVPATLSIAEEFTIEFIRTLEGEDPGPVEEDLRAIKEGRLPGSQSLRLVLWALVSHGSFGCSESLPAETSAHDTDTDISIAHRASVRVPFVQIACRNFEELKVLIEKSEDKQDSDLRFKYREYHLYHPSSDGFKSVNYWKKLLKGA